MAASLEIVSKSVIMIEGKLQYQYGRRQIDETKYKHRGNRKQFMEEIYWEEKKRNEQRKENKDRQAEDIEKQSAIVGRLLRQFWKRFGGLSLSLWLGCGTLKREVLVGIPAPQYLAGDFCSTYSLSNSFITRILIANCRWEDVAGETASERPVISPHVPRLRKLLAIVLVVALQLP